MTKTVRATDERRNAGNQGLDAFEFRPRESPTLTLLGEFYSLRANRRLALRRLRGLRTAPSTSVHRAPKSNFDAPKSNFDAPELNFDAPESNFDAPELNFDARESNFDAPALNFDARESNFDAPALNFDAPESSFGAFDCKIDARAAFYPA